MSYDLHPRPIVDDLLFLKDSHRARDIFNIRELTKLVFRRADQKFFSLLNSSPITDNVKRYIDIAGFGGLIDSGYRNLDHVLLEALIERWRPETHTFHLPIGEVTVTLKVVNVLWGLPIESEVVSGCEQPSSLADRIVRCHTLLDSTACGHLSWGSIVLAMLYRNLCNATSSNSSTIGGPLYILQLWAWIRITTLAPTFLHRFDNQRPYGAMWREKLTYKDVVSHSLRACRSQLHSLREGEMDRISQTYRQAGDFMHTESTLNFQNFETLQNTANQAETSNVEQQNFEAVDAYGFSGISQLPSLDLNLQMSVGDLDDDTFLANTLNAENVDEYPPVSESEDEHLYDVYDSEVLEHAWDYGKHEDDPFDGQFHNPYEDEQDSDWSNDDYHWK
ncbi:hypothetical protein E3N88_29655 [Mikania micrantha]|uniref:Aminotransferase-like plant mobile domain-containing protein n=1 Tax=Mikania micrantha TaxID=192012 RepID=A0A5N6MK67_9ASTR|nr:hypothetical protein E3N88_29655 [Mikania micrantha]